MASPPETKEVQLALAALGLDGWLFYFFQENDPIARRVLALDPASLFTRRWFYFIPRRGEPRKIVHAIEPEALDHLPGRKAAYASWKELRLRLAEALPRRGKVAMQYSPRAAVPTLSKADAGTVELVRSLGIAVVSSGDLVQLFEAVLSPAQWHSHRRTAEVLKKLVFSAFSMIGKKLRRKAILREIDVQRHIRQGYSRHGLTSNAAPIVAAGPNSGRPHYMPSAASNRRIKRGDWVLVDIWAKGRRPDDVYADITWCGYAGETVPGKFERIFQIVREARDRALDLIRERTGRKIPVKGWEADRAARSHIDKMGYGLYFIHRTGHSIGREDHGPGANLDSLETWETRRLLPGTLFSIEPGIYLKEFGARSEINVFLDGNQVLVSGTPVQEHVIPILRRSAY